MNRLTVVMYGLKGLYTSWVLSPRSYASLMRECPFTMLFSSTMLVQASGGRRIVEVLGVVKCFRSNTASRPAVSDAEAVEGFRRPVACSPPCQDEPLSSVGR